jgi:CBS domain-containing protein
VLREEIVEYLGRILPFNLLSEEELGGVAEDIALEYYPRGYMILRQDGPPSEHLRIIRKGGVKVYVTSDEGEELVIDYRSEGELFGLLSVVSGDRSRANVVALEDTVCFLVPRDRVMALTQRHPRVSEYFLKSFFLNFIDKSYEETRRKFSAVGEADRLLFTTPVGSIMSRRAVTCAASDTIREAAGTMAREKVSSIVVLGAKGGEPVGIVTDRDLREKVVAAGRSVADAVETIMTSPIIRIEAREAAFEALLSMIRHKIHHILVVEQGRFAGMVTNHDFMVLQGSSPTVLVREVEEAASVADLAARMPKVFKTAASLLREGAGAGNVAGLMSEIHEKMILRAVALAEERLGPPPLAYTLFLCGDGARREWSLSPRVKMGIALATAPDLVRLDAGRAWALALGAEIDRTLAACGMAPAGAPPAIPAERCGTVAEWRGRIREWTVGPFRETPDLDDFEMRAVRGPEDAVAEIRSALFDAARGDSDFMDYIAATTVRDRPPLGFFKRFVVEKSGEHRNELNLYERGIRPLTGALRILCLEGGIREIQTLRRLELLAARDAVADGLALEHALECFYTLLIRHQIAQAERGVSPDDFINPETLGVIERKTLKESFERISALMSGIEKRYGAGRIG